mgnify:FL=1
MPCGGYFLLHGNYRLLRRIFFMGILSSIFGGGKKSPENQYDILCDDGVRAMQMGEFKYAEKCLTAALELKHELRTVGFLAEVYLHTENYEKALPLLREMVQHAEGDNLEISLLLAQTLGKTQVYADERTTCQDILQKHEGEPRALYLLAEAEHGLHEDLMAIAHLTQCLAQEPQYQHALLLRAEVLKQMGQWTEVLADAEALVAIDAENESYHLLRAEAYAALGKTDEAVADLKAVQALNPFSQEAVLKLGSLYEQTAQWDKALAVYDEAIQMQPNFAAAYKARGGVKNHLKDVVGAAADLKRSLELEPELAKAVDGEYVNVENEMKERYKRMNPYGF